MQKLKRPVSILLSLIMVLSVFTIVPISASAEAQTYVDTIVADAIPATQGQSYYDWDEELSAQTDHYYPCPVNSSAVYNGNTSYEYKNSIPTFKIRVKNSGIYTTGSGGNVSKVTATWLDNKADRSLLIYGKDTPYESVSDLYDSEKQGELIGTLAFAKGQEDDTLSCTFNGNYPYIGFAVNAGTIYLQELSIEWTTGCVAHSWTEDDARVEWNWTPQDGEDPGSDGVSASMTATCADCGETQTVDGVVEHNGDDPASCTADGHAHYTATAVLDGKTFNDTKDYSLPTAGHNLSYVPEAAPTYDAENEAYHNGNEAYYECSVCHKLFAAEDGETELDSVPVVPYFTFEMSDSHVVLTGSNGHDASVVVPKKVPQSYLEYDPDAQEIVDAYYGIEEIAANAFKDHTDLVDLQFLKFIQLVGKSAFEGCSSLENISFEDGVGEIKANAFDDCSSLESLTVDYIVRDGIDSPNFANTPDELTFIGAHVTGATKSKLMTAAETFGKKMEANDAHVYGDEYYVLDGESINKLHDCVAGDDTEQTAVYSVEKQETPATICLTGGYIEHYETTTGEKLYFIAKEDPAHENEMQIVERDDLYEAPHELTHVAYKAPGNVSDGNIEYWYCPICGKYYKEVDGEKVEITKAQTVIPMNLRKLEAGQVYALGEHFAYPMDKPTKNRYSAHHGFSTGEPYGEYYVSASNGFLNMSTGWGELAVIFGAPDKVFAGLFYVTYSDAFELGAVYYNANVTPQVKWSDDGKTVTFTLKNFYKTLYNYDRYDTINYTLTKTVDVVDTVIPATCSENGKTEHKATLVQGNYTYDAVRYDIDESDPPTGVHTYGEPAWTWADDHSSATATFTCSGCGDTVTVTDDVISVNDVIPAEPGVGERTYNAEVEFNGVTYTTSEVVDVRYRSVTWKNDDSEVLEFDHLVEDGKPHEYNGETPTKASDETYDYTFDAWAMSYDEDENYVYTATYTPVKHFSTVIWQNWDGTELEKDENVPRDTVPEYNGDEPKRESTVDADFTFSGWSPEVGAVTNDITYTAVYTETIHTYTVLWKDEDGTELEKDEDVPYGTTPTYNSVIPTKESTVDTDYTFSGWSPAVSAVTGDAVYTATYSATSATAWNRLQNLINTVENGGIIKLTDDCVAASSDSAILVPAGKIITIDLNGHTINRNRSAKTTNGNVITNNGTLMITDTSEEQTGTITGGHNASKGGGVINNSGATFTLAGGAIKNNQIESSGGAGIVNHGTLNITGGTISGNTVYGSGVNGGGIWTNGTANISGGTITGNRTQTGNGGGIFFKTGSTLNISGSPVITGNLSNRGNTDNDLYLERNAAQAINVTGPLDPSARIGIRERARNTGEAFTNGLSGYGTADNFFANYADTAIRINSSGEAYTVQTYTITFGNAENGTVTADQSAAAAGDIVTLTAVPDDGYILSSFTVKNASDQAVTITDNQFTMPASNVTVTATFESQGAHLAGHTISLDGDIAVNFYMELTDDVINSAEDPYMLFTVPDTSTEYRRQEVYVKDVTPITKEGKSYYIFKCRVAAKDMDSIITAQLINGEKTGSIYTYSVKEYAEYLIAHQNDSQTYKDAADLVQAMLTYGENAKLYFDDAAEAGEAVSAEIPEAYSAYTVEGLGDIEFAGATVSLKSQTSLSLYFKSSEKPTFTCDNYHVETVSVGEYWVARIRGIKAKNIGGYITLTVNGTGSVTYSPLTYCKSIAENTSKSEKLRNVVKALYLYWKAADAYWKP